MAQIKTPPATDAYRKGWDRTYKKNLFVCKQCGKCCKDYGDAYQWSVGQEYVDMLKDKGRTDISAWVDLLIEGTLYDIWIHPRTGEDARKCPWLKKNGDKYICRIQGVKPPVCADYPVTKAQALKFGCKGYDNGKNQR
jgi:Fe-S-cluster containining protein